MAPLHLISKLKGRNVPFIFKNTPFRLKRELSCSRGDKGLSHHISSFIVSGLLFKFYRHAHFIYLVLLYIMIMIYLLFFAFKILSFICTIQVVCALISFKSDDSFMVLLFLQTAVYILYINFYALSCTRNRDQLIPKILEKVRQILSHFFSILNQKLIDINLC